MKMRKPVAYGSGILGLAIAVFGWPRAAQAQEWTHYGNDAGGMRYSKLNQINKKNVKQLKVAWVYDTGDVSDGKGAYLTRSSFEDTPLVVGNVMYVMSAFNRLIALDAETGKELWSFDPHLDPKLRTNLLSSRGATYWSDRRNATIFFGDIIGRLWAVDAVTGKLRPGFAQEGMLDVHAIAAGHYMNLQFGISSPPAVCGNVLVSDDLVSDGAPRGPSGDVFAWDLKTGAPRWRFHTVPGPGELGHDTWGSGTEERGGTNAWSAMAVDEKTGTIFVPVTSPSYDFWGGDRKGANLFGDSVVAVDCNTGQRKWHFQTVHHDLWDYDLPAQPVLVTVKRNGRDVPAVAQVTKTGFVFVLNRATGEPLFPVEERPVPKSGLPGEEAYPTQPIPVLPPPVARQSMTRDELTDVTLESHAECAEMTKDAILDVKIYTPFGEKTQAIFPGFNGGTNWGSASFDPVTNLLFVNTMDVGGLFRMVKRPEGSEVPYVLRSATNTFFWDSRRYPCQKPPWGNLTAIDLNTGQFKWRVVLGEFDELTARGIPKTGAPNIGGPMVTAGGLVFIGATDDGKFRAFDKDTGEEVWMTRLPASGFATPMTYTGKKTGKQFVVIAAGGGNKYDLNFSGKLVAYSLP